MRTIKQLGPLLVATLLVGCNVGNAPPTMTETEVQDAVAKLPPQEQIDYINRSPLPPAEKQKRIDEIKAKAGLTDADIKPAPPTSGQ